MLKFSDIDECISNSCDTNANCENVIGSYNCKCKGGFTGDGTSCKGNYIIMYNTVKYNCWPSHADVIFIAAKFFRNWRMYVQSLPHKCGV